MPAENETIRYRNFLDSFLKIPGSSRVRATKRDLPRMEAVYIGDKPVARAVLKDLEDTTEKDNTDEEILSTNNTIHEKQKRIFSGAENAETALVAPPFTEFLSQYINQEAFAFALPSIVKNYAFEVARIKLNDTNRVFKIQPVTDNPQQLKVQIHHLFKKPKNAQLDIETSVVQEEGEFSVCLEVTLELDSTNNVTINNPVILYDSKIAKHDLALLQNSELYFNEEPKDNPNNIFNFKKEKLVQEALATQQPVSLLRPKPGLAEEAADLREKAKEPEVIPVTQAPKVLVPPLPLEKLLPAADKSATVEKQRKAILSKRAAIRQLYRETLSLGITSMAAGAALALVGGALLGLSFIALPFVPVIPVAVSAVAAISIIAGLVMLATGAALASYNAYKLKTMTPLDPKFAKSFEPDDTKLDAMRQLHQSVANDLSTTDSTDSHIYDLEHDESATVTQGVSVPSDSHIPDGNDNSPRDSSPNGEQNGSPPPSPRR